MSSKRVCKSARQKVTKVMINLTKEKTCLEVAMCFNVKELILVWVLSHLILLFTMSMEGSRVKVIVIIATVNSNI